MSSKQKFDAETAKSALLDILRSFSLPENQLRMDTARESAGNDMLKAMHIVFPVATHIQMQALPKYGFTGDGDGLVQFTQAVKSVEKLDGEVLRLNEDLRRIVMPQMLTPMPQGAET